MNMRILRALGLGLALIAACGSPEPGAPGQAGDTSAAAQAGSSYYLAWLLPSGILVVGLVLAVILWWRRYR